MLRTYTASVPPGREGRRSRLVLGPERVPPRLRTRVMPPHWTLRVLTLWLASFAVVSCSLSEPGGSPARPGDDRAAEGASDGDAFQMLRERPVRLPALREGEPCPLSGAIELPGIPAEAGLGPGTGPGKLSEGPVYVAFPSIPRNLDLLPPTRRGRRTATILVTSRESYRGPVLLRGRRLAGGADIDFATSSVGRPELRLPAGPWEERMGRFRVWGRAVDPEPRWRVAIVDVSLGTGGCYGFRLDGSSFSYAILFSATWQG
jgi:hypothetical protein